MAGLDPKTKSYLGFHIYRYVKSKYRPHLSDKEKGAVIHEIFDEVHELVRKFGESKVEWKEKIFEEIRENWETGAKKDIVDLIKKTFEDYERGKKEEERIEREVSKKKRIKIKHTPYTCTYEGCEGKVLEYEYEDGEKVYYCEKNPDEHFWLSQGDLKEETEKFAERKVGEGITEPKPPHEGIAEIDALFKEMSGYPSMSKIIKALKKKEEWNKLSMEDKKAYVSKFLKHPALKNKIKGLQGKKRKLGFLPVPWWASPEYYEEANVLTGFQERKEEAAIEIGYERDKLRKKYGPWKWWLRPKYYAEKNAKVGELRDKYYMGGGFGSEEEAFLRGRLIGGINRIAGRHSDHVRGVMPAIVIFGLGAVISIILGSLMFFFAFCSLAFQQLMPPAKEKTDNEGKGIGEWENLGSAYLRSVFKCTAIILFALGIGQTNLPFANIFLMLVAVGGYAAMKVTYHSKRPDELVESFIRFGFLGILAIPWFIFAQIFGSMTLGLLALMFFAVPPIKVGGETEAIERSFAYQIWKPIFMVGMIIVLVSSGAIPINLGIFNLGWALEGSLAYIFLYIWIVSFLAGIFTSPENLPSIGIIVLIVTTVIFGLGPGAQNVGIALFGQWWPTVHNTVTEFTKPIGDLFYQLSQTFGQTLFMITNPMGFAQQITEGTYVENPMGPTGAYGLEINNLHIDGIYVGEVFSIRFELNNKGSFDARNVNLEILTSIEKFKEIYDQTEQRIDLVKSEKAKKENYIEWFNYTYPITNRPVFEKITKQDIKPRFLFGKIDCEGQTSIKKMLGITTAAGAALREKFIPFMARIKYEYEVHSNLQIEVLSKQEWDSRVRNGVLIRGQKLSRISTAPAKLSIGAMDQPIPENFPMFIGFNLSSEEGRNSKLGVANVRVELPEGFVKDKNMLCTEKKKPYTDKGIIDGKWVIEWELGEDEPKHVICFFNAPEIGDVPSKTFTISASATYTFYRWDRDDTLINFLDACEESRGEETENVSSIKPGDAGYCKSQPDGLCKEVGEGGCFYGGAYYCDRTAFYKPKQEEEYVTSLKCYTTVNEGKGACCPGEGVVSGTRGVIEGVTNNQCQAAFDAWMEGKSETDIMNAMWAAS